jgi:hypothetical protein
MLAVLLAVLHASGLTAHAESDRTLSWRAPPGCPDLLGAEARLVSLTGDEASRRRGHAVVTIDLAPTGDVRARVALLRRDGSEHRVFYAQSCEAVTDAALLVLADAHEQTAPHTPARPVPPSTAPVSSAPETAGTAPSKPHAQRAVASDLTVPRTADSAASSKRSHRVAFGPALSVDVGALPRATWGFGAAISLEHAQLRAELDGRYWLSQDTHEPTGHNAELGLVSAALRASYTWSRAGVRSLLASCAALELGQATGRGVDLADARSASALWAAVLVGLDVSLGPYGGRLAPRARAEVGLPLRRPSFDLEGGSAVFQSARFIGRVSIGVALAR